MQKAAANHGGMEGVFHQAGLSQNWKGIGPYTGTIASIPFGLPEPTVDSNVVNVLTRLFGSTTISGSQPIMEFSKLWWNSWLVQTVLVILIRLWWLGSDVSPQSIHGRESCQGLAQPANLEPWMVSIKGQEETVPVFHLYYQGYVGITYWRKMSEKKGLIWFWHFLDRSGWSFVP